MGNSPPKRGDAAKIHKKQQMVRYAIGGVVMLAVVGLIAFVTANAEPAATVEDIAGDVTVDGQQLPPFQTVENDTSIGQTSPAVESQDFDGNTVSVGDTGRPTLVGFMASWCPACQQELPHIVEWQEQGRDDVDIVIVTTSLDRTRPNWPPNNWLDEERYRGAVLRDDADSTVAQTFGMSGTPFWVAIDAEGDVVFRMSGVMGVDQIDALADFVVEGPAEQVIEGP